jgi:hemolysin activation/secretion protein
MSFDVLKRIALGLMLAFSVTPGSLQASQTPVDQADPSVIEEQLRQDDRARPKQRPNLRIARPPAGATDVESSIVVGGVRVAGATALRPAAFARAVEPYLGRTLAPSDLQSLASDVADVARNSGFGLATAWVPQQQVTAGILVVMLDEGRIDDIRIEGNALQARRVLAPLAGGRPVRTAELERQLLVAGDLAGVRVGKVRLDRVAGKNILVVQAVHRRIETRAYVDNWGSSTVGPVRARLTVDFNDCSMEPTSSALAASSRRRSRRSSRSFALATPGRSAWRAPN